LTAWTTDFLLPLSRKSFPSARRSYYHQAKRASYSSRSTTHACGDVVWDELRHWTLEAIETNSCHATKQHVHKSNL